MRVATVFVNIPAKQIAKAFSYSVPDELSFVGAGWRVFVPFGGRRAEGFILQAGEQSKEEIEKLGFSLKDIIAAVDEEAWFTPEMMAAAVWLSRFYLCSPAEMMRLFMPGKSGLKITVRYAADETQADHLLLHTPAYRELYRYLLQEGPKKKQELAKALPALADGLPEMLAKLSHYKIIRREYDADKREKAIYRKYVRLAGEPGEDLLEDCRRHKKAQYRLLELLQQQEWSVAELREKKISSAVIKALAEAGLIEIRQKRILRDSYREAAQAPPGGEPLQLTEAQAKALNRLKAAAERELYQAFLLQGVTGSGKTQVYIEISRLVRAAGRQVIILVPEIALTGQVVMAFKQYFPHDIVVLHSQLSLPERNDAMHRVRRRQAGVIIGARSALFVPAPDIGLIVMDEEQDMSYKQDESPRYHARVVAEQLASLHKAVLLLGTATPSLESYHRARSGEFIHLRLPERIGQASLPSVQCVDMREELRRGNRRIISGALGQLLEETLSRHEQAVIMLNRRGFSTFVLCRACGAVLKCNLCGLPLVYHMNGRLACHHCDMAETVPDTCPHCGSRYIKYFGSGTEKLEKELRERWPGARVIRMDRDTTGRKFAHQEILARFRNHEYDILLGTQMVAKGHDIPDVTAVGVISADASLNMPDFRAAERCFMLITQTAGRAGRHGKQGRVVIQTYNPGHYAVTYGMAQDYEGFYEQEIKFRQELFYPPCSRLVKLVFQDKSEQEAREAAAMLAEAFRQRFPEGRKHRAVGPSPANIACFKGVYRFVVLIKTADLPPVQDFLREQKLHLRKEVAIDIDPIAML